MIDGGRLVKDEAPCGDVGLSHAQEVVEAVGAETMLDIMQSDTVRSAQSAHDGFVV